MRLQAAAQIAGRGVNPVSAKPAGDSLTMCDKAGGGSCLSVEHPSRQTGSHFDDHKSVVERPDLPIPAVTSAP